MFSAWGGAADFMTLVAFLFWDSVQGFLEFPPCVRHTACQLNVRLFAAQGFVSGMAVALQDAFEILQKRQRTGMISPSLVIVQHHW